MKKGLVHIYTGEGKGKTTASLGLAIRAAGFGQKVLIAQFFKEEGAASGEKEFFKKYASSGIELIRSDCRHPIFTREKTDLEKVNRAIRATFEAVKRKTIEEGYGLVVLDEIMAAVKGNWVSIDEVMELIDKKPEGTELVLTGRDAPPELVRIADYVTEMLKIKHPYDNGIPARKGVEY